LADSKKKWVFTNLFWFQVCRCTFVITPKEFMNQHW
jgi:hypothetical protein